MTTEQDLQFRILGTDHDSYIFIDKYSDDEVWLNANVRGGNTRLVISNEQAKDMIAALIRIVEAK